MRAIKDYLFDQPIVASNNWKARGNDTQAFCHTLWRLALTDKCIRAGGECGLLTGVQMADEDNDQRGRAGLSESVKSRSRCVGE